MKTTLITLATLVATASAAVPVLAAPAARTVLVSEREYSIALSVRPRAGTTTFVIRNAGDDAHDFRLRGGGKTVRSRVLGESATARLTTRLERGVRYTYWCGVSDHAGEGMRGSFVAR